MTAVSAARRILACLALVCGLAACGDDEASGGADASSPDAGSRDGGSLTQTEPLTGLPVDGALPEHPVVTVKIDNTGSSAPQLGLSSADLVTEELVEGGLTRLAAMYYSDIPDVVGPVRSMRASDIGIVTPAESVLVAAGGAPPTRARIADAEIGSYGEGDPGFYRADDRTSPYDLMVRLPELVDALDEAEPPPPYLPFGPNPLTGGARATAVDVSFSAGSTTSWRFENETYVRPASNAAEGDDFAADSVLVLRVELGDAGYKDPAGNPVPETLLEGSGDALLFSAGRVVRGTWTKQRLDSPVQLSGEDGPMTVPPGHTWVELAPVDAEGGGVRISR